MSIKKIGLALLAGGALLISAFLGQAVADNGYGKQKVVYHINYDNPKKQAGALRNIQNHINAVGAENMEIKVVMHGNGVAMVLEPDASGSPVGSSFSYATARDWARMGEFWLQEGLWNGEMLLPKEWIRWSTSPAPAALMGQYGAQFWLNAGVEGEHLALPDLPPSMYFAHGFNSQIVAVFPEQEAVIARLVYTTDDSWDDNAFLAAILAAL